MCNSIPKYWIQKCFAASSKKKKKTLPNNPSNWWKDAFLYIVSVCLCVCAAAVLRNPFTKIYPFLWKKIVFIISHVLYTYIYVRTHIEISFTLKFEIDGGATTRRCTHTHINKEMCKRATENNSLCDISLLPKMQFLLLCVVIYLKCYDDAAAHSAHHHNKINILTIMLFPYIYFFFFDFWLIIYLKKKSFKNWLIHFGWFFVVVVVEYFWWI